MTIQGALSAVAASLGLLLALTLVGVQHALLLVTVLAVPVLISSFRRGPRARRVDP